MYQAKNTIFIVAVHVCMFLANCRLWRDEQGNDRNLNWQLYVRLKKSTCMRVEKWQPLNNLQSLPSSRICRVPGCECLNAPCGPAHKLKSDIYLSIKQVWELQHGFLMSHKDNLGASERVNEGTHQRPDCIERGRCSVQEKFAEPGKTPIHKSFDTIGACDWLSWVLTYMTCVEGCCIHTHISGAYLLLWPHALTRSFIVLDDLVDSIFFVTNKSHLSKVVMSNKW